MNGIKIITTNEYPLCPHCEKELETILKNVEFQHLFTNLHTIYICPHCKKLLSIGND